MVSDTQKLGANYIELMIESVDKEIRHSCWYKELFMDQESGVAKKEALKDLAKLLHKIHNGDELPESVSKVLTAGKTVNLKVVIEAWENIDKGQEKGNKGLIADTIDYQRIKPWCRFFGSEQSSTRGFVEKLKKEYGALDVNFPQRP